GAWMSGSGRRKWRLRRSYGRARPAWVPAGSDGAWSPNCVEWNGTTEITVDIKISNGTALMLLVVDVGNSNTVLGVFAKVAKGEADSPASEALGYELVANWRLATVVTQTVDEYGVL